MNPRFLSPLLCLRQDNRDIEEYVQDFCGLCYLVAFNDVALKDIFRVGLNEPIRSQLPGGEIHWSLEQYIDHTLFLAGSSFTVGIADEEPRYPTVRTAPEHFHIPDVMSVVVHIMDFCACQATACSCHICRSKACYRHAGRSRACYHHAVLTRVCSRHAVRARVCSRHARVCSCHGLFVLVM